MDALDPAAVARIAKFQKLWRSKRVFTNTQGSWKVSSSYITTKIVSFKVEVDLDAIEDASMSGLEEVMAYKATFKKPIARWTPGTGWIGEWDGVSKVIAKKGQQTVSITKNGIDVLGAGNYEPSILTLIKNGWIPRSVAHMKPSFKNINGVFYINTHFTLEDLGDELRKLPSSMVQTVSYTQALTKVGVPAVILKLQRPKFTYQFFENGTVLFSGLKDPADKDVPRHLFKEFFTPKYGLIAMMVMNLGKPRAIGKPGAKSTANKKAKLANRNPLAGTWNALTRPPPGFYIRPGTNEKPRLYMWRKMKRHPSTREWLNMGAMNLSGVGPKVVKAFRNAGRNIPQSTINAFRMAGAPLILNANESVPKQTAHANRRAPSWSATKPGFYVRPGPGQQPYWFKVPTGIASGRKTVISTYTKAGRNIPQAVRNIFKIPANVKTNVVALGNQVLETGLQHRVTMGLNSILRINNRQATRLTKAELLAIARNMEIPEANSKMTPATIIKLIQSKAGAHKPIRNADVYVNGMYYRFMNNGRVEKTTDQGVQTRRNWSTIPVAEQNKIAKKLLPANLHSEYNATAKPNRFNTLRAYLASTKPAPKVPSPPKPARQRTPSPSPNSNNNNGLALEMEYAVRLGQNLGNLSRQGNEALFMNIYRGLPSGARGKPLKATVNQAYKKFVKTTKAERIDEPSKARYIARIKVPNWMPVNKVAAYKNLVTSLAFQKPKPKVANMKAAVKAWINREAPQSPARAARNVENMITGKMVHIPAHVPRPRGSPNIPKRSPQPKKSPKAKKYDPAKSPRLQEEYALPNNRTAITNLNNAIANLGLPTKSTNTYTWSGLVRRGLDPKFRNNWLKYVARRT